MEVAEPRTFAFLLLPFILKELGSPRVEFKANFIDLMWALELFYYLLYFAGRPSFLHFYHM